MDWLMEIIANKFNTQALVSWIQKNPALAVELQKNLTQETCSLFDGKLKVLRMGQGILTPFDVLEQNTQIANAIQFICEHNYLYFLELIHRYDLIREIFQDKEHFTNVLQLIDELERHYTHMQRRQAWQEANDKAIDQAKYKIYSNTNDLLASNNNYMDLLHYYAHKEIQIHSRYHEQQIESHKIATTNYMSVLKDTHNILHKNEHIDDQKKEELDKELKILEEEYQIIDKMPTHNLAEKTEKAARYEAHTQKLNALCKSLHEDHPHVEELNPLRARREKIEETHNKEQKQNREQRDAELAEIKPHLKMVQEKVKESLLKNMDSVIKTLKKSDLSQLSEQEQKQFAQIYRQLNDEREHLNNSTTYKSLKESHTKFRTNLEQIGILLKSPVLSAQQYREFQHDTKMLQSFNFSELELQVHSSNQASPSSNRGLSPEAQQAPNAPNAPELAQQNNNPNNSEPEADLQRMNKQDISAQYTQKYRDQVQDIRRQAKDPEMQKLYTQFSNYISQLKDALNMQQPGSNPNLLNENEPGSEQANIDELEPGSAREISDDEPALIRSLIKQLEDLQRLEKISEIPEDSIFFMEDSANALASLNDQLKNLVINITDTTMSIMESKEALAEEPSEQRSYGL